MNDFALTIRNLSVKKGNLQILDNINCEIETGSYVSIVGPNGSGKTTLLKTIIGLNKDFSGDILLFGEKLCYRNANSIAYVPQVKTLDRTFPALAIELVISGFKQKWAWKVSENDKKIAISFLEQVGAIETAYKRLSDLSGGELQRVYLARSLSKEPKLLLLDEPATGIDLVCEQSINSLLSDFNHKLKTTILMVTHDWSSAYHHTNKSLLLNKNLVFYGDSKEAFTENNLQNTFSHPGHKHGVSFGLKELI
ncbi:MAG TPA: metal ABC transporter ATP-binding protein [Candidatus Kapabacteria bacterium]|nr:metal ABC transporter ATP-binding protein [Candidatus Kapabacteria bacterium]